MSCFQPTGLLGPVQGLVPVTLLGRLEAPPGVLLRGFSVAFHLGQPIGGAVPCARFLAGGRSGQ